LTYAIRDANLSPEQFIPGYREPALSADGTAVNLRRSLTANDRRLLLPIEEVAGLLDVSIATLKRQHLADPASYPAKRIGTLWRIPRAWVEAQAAWPTPEAIA